jgi:L-alanine-DL-glutamate epimerase-like enolase superfamily enzyme
MLQGREAFREMIVRQAADIIQPDVPRSCGMRDMKKIGDLADLYSVSLAPHNMCSPIGTLAAVHACAAMPNFLALENHCKVIPWWDDCVVAAAPLIQRGYIEVPEGPGLGCIPNEAVLQQHCHGPLWG